jgi:hypothetical protein
MLQDLRSFPLTPVELPGTGSLGATSVDTAAGPVPISNPSALRLTRSVDAAGRERLFSHDFVR